VLANAHWPILRWITLGKENAK